jgi:hypothetical protein
MFEIESFHDGIHLIFWFSGDYLLATQKNKATLVGVGEIQ